MTNTYKQLKELAEGNFKGNIMKIFTGIKETIESMKKKEIIKNSICSYYSSRGLGNEKYPEEGEIAA